MTREPQPKPLEYKSPKDRMTVILRVHHQCQDEGVTTGGCSYDEELETDHEAYGRRLKVGEEWQPLDFGWVPVEDVGMVVVENLAGRNLRINPTDEERQAIADRVLEVRHEGDARAYAIPPRGADSFRSTDPSSLRIRSRKGETKYKIMVVPR